MRATSAGVMNRGLLQFLSPSPPRLRFGSAERDRHIYLLSPEEESEFFHPMALQEFLGISG